MRTAQKRQPEEIIPGTIFPRPLGVREVLAIYSELSRTDPQVEDGVRQMDQLIQFQAYYPPMTHAQALEVLEQALQNQARILVDHSDPSHIVFRLSRKPST